MVGLSIFAAVVAGVVWIVGAGGDPPTPSSRERDRVNTLFVRPEGTGEGACGEYIATWLDLLHAENAFPINELKADVGQGPLWVAVMDIWGKALDLETRQPREEVARRLAPAIAAACLDPDVLGQFIGLRPT